jgi:hypothetical protein
MENLVEQLVEIHLVETRSVSLRTAMISLVCKCKLKDISCCRHCPYFLSLVSIGTLALAHYLGDRDTNEYPPTNFILELAENVLPYNYFRFDDEYYLQTNGTFDGLHIHSELC